MRAYRAPTLWRQPRQAALDVLASDAPPLRPLAFACCDDRSCSRSSLKAARRRLARSTDGSPQQVRRDGVTPELGSELGPDQSRGGRRSWGRDLPRSAGAGTWSRSAPPGPRRGHATRDPPFLSNGRSAPFWFDGGRGRRQRLDQGAVAARSGCPQMRDPDTARQRRAGSGSAPPTGSAGQGGAAASEPRLADFDIRRSGRGPPTHPEVRQSSRFRTCDKPEDRALEKARRQPKTRRQPAARAGRFWARSRPLQRLGSTRGPRHGAGQAARIRRRHLRCAATRRRGPGRGSAGFGSDASTGQRTPPAQSMPPAIDADRCRPMPPIGL